MKLIMKNQSQKTQKGFTLIELMGVIIIIGLLTMISVPVYQDYTVRTKVSEAVLAGSAAKILVSDAFQTDSLAGIEVASKIFRAKVVADSKAIQSKYVGNIDITPEGVITVTTAKDNQGLAGSTGLPSDAQSMTIVFSPNVQNNAPAAGVVGTLDWACATESKNTATDRGFGNITLGTLPAKYAPLECR